MRGNATARVSMQFFVVTTNTAPADLWLVPDGAIGQPTRTRSLLP